MVLIRISHERVEIDLLGDSYYPGKGCVALEILAFSFNATLPVILCMALGMLLRRTGSIDPPTANRLSTLCFQVFLPTLAFKNVYSIDFSIDFSLPLVLFAFFGILFVVAVLLMILYPLFHRDMEWTAAAAHVGFRSNYLMFGIPLAQNMFGEQGVQIASMLIPVAVIPYNFVTVFLFTLAGSQEGESPAKVAKKTLINFGKNPLIIASLLGLAGSLSGIAFPTFLNSALDSIAGVASPLCLIVLGAQITLGRLPSPRNRVIALTATRLVFVPLGMIALAVWMGFRGPELGALFVLFASPCANSCLIMSKQYDVKPEFTAYVVALTTLLSGLTTFFGISLLRWLEFF